MNQKAVARRRRIRRQQNERKRTNDAKKAEAKLLASVESDTPMWWGKSDVGVKIDVDGNTVISWGESVRTVQI